MRGQRAPSSQIFLPDKQDVESIFPPRKFPVIPQRAGGTLQRVLAVGRTAVVLFLRQDRHQHIPRWGLHVGKGTAHREHAAKKGNVMALFHKRKLCRHVLKYLRERACPSDGFREVFAQKRKEMVVQLGSVCSLCEVPAASLAGSWKGRQYSKARMAEEQGGMMTL